MHTSMLDQILERVRERERPHLNPASPPPQMQRPGAAPRHILPLGQDFFCIAECKRQSPSAGLLRPRYQPERLALQYAHGGAGAISVLTEPEFFGGSWTDLERVRHSVCLPILNKDFILYPHQVDRAWAHGADLILLIVAALDTPELLCLKTRADQLGLTCLVEVHQRCEWERIAPLWPTGSYLLGINNRDLTRMVTRLETSLELLPLIPPEQAVISESGIRSAGDLRRLQAAGARGALIGESLLRQGQPDETLARWLHDLA